MAVVVRVVLSLLLLMVAGGCITEKDEPVVSLAVGDAVPQFSVTLDDGSQFDYDIVRRHPCVIVFFDTSCPDCRAALPVIQSVASELAASTSGIPRDGVEVAANAVFTSPASRDEALDGLVVTSGAGYISREPRGDALDVRFICISRGETQPSVAAYWQEAGLTLPYSAQPDDAVYRLFANRILPRVYVTRPAAPLPVISALFVERLTPEAPPRRPPLILPLPRPQSPVHSIVPIWNCRRATPGTHEMKSLDLWLRTAKRGSYHRLTLWAPQRGLCANALDRPRNPRFV